MQTQDKDIASLMDAKGVRIGIVRARFNHAITTTMHTHCLKALKAMNVQDKDIHSVDVPGALEVPVALQALAETNDFDALIALGCIIRGETYHFELVSNESGAGITRVSLDYQTPIANAILTVENEAQALARVEEKSADAARVAVEMAFFLESLS
jgi:6,7-dimethyl-8-ribityllumazine synthase